MSIDSLGRVIVGSGHFVEAAPGIINNIARVVVGAGHQYDMIYNAVQHGRDVANNVDHYVNWTRRVVDDRIPETAREAYNREVEDRLHRLGGAGLDIVQAYGWAASGDLQSAWEKLVDAAVTTGQVFVEGIANPPPTHN